MTAQTHPVEREQLMAYLDGELAANEAARVATHLQECAECQRLEADLRSVSAQMLSWNVEPAPTQLNDGVLAALHADAPQHTAKEPWNLFRFLFQGRIRIARWGLTAACVGVAAMILLKVFRSFAHLFSVQRTCGPTRDVIRRCPQWNANRETLTGGGGGGRRTRRI